MPIWELLREPGRRALSLGACILPEAALAFALMPLLRAFPHPPLCFAASYYRILSGRKNRSESILRGQAWCLNGLQSRACVCKGACRHALSFSQSRRSKRASAFCQYPSQPGGAFEWIEERCMSMRSAFLPFSDWTLQRRPVPFPQIASICLRSYVNSHVFSHTSPAFQ